MTVVIALICIAVLMGCVGPFPNVNTTNKTNPPGGEINTTINSTNQTGNSSVNNTGNTPGNQCSPNVVYFIHADWCPHCQKMKPWVQQLEGEGYEFFWAESSNTSAIQIATSCLQGIAKMQYIPEFVCISNRGDHVGEFASIDEMRAFADECGAKQ